MINANDLRIGNRIKSGNGIYKVVLIGDIFCIGEYHDGKVASLMLGLVNGILLTPDLLEQYGFDKQKSADCFDRDIWHIQVNNNDAIWYDPNNTDEEWYLAQDWNNNHYQNGFWNKPKYLHQLQNLYYSLTGEELLLKNEKPYSSVSKS